MTKYQTAKTYLKEVADQVKKNTRTTNPCAGKLSTTPWTAIARSTTWQSTREICWRTTPVNYIPKKRSTHEGKSP